MEKDKKRKISYIYIWHPDWGNVEKCCQILNCYKNIRASQAEKGGNRQGIGRFSEKILLTRFGRDVILFNRCNNFVTT